jgi:hypothetical protein
MKYLSLLVLILGMAGCAKPPRPTETFTMIETACAGRHVYWRVDCDNTRPFCTAKAWTGSSDAWKGHTQGWLTYDDDRYIAATKLADLLKGPPNVDVTDRTFDTGVQECKRAGAQ